MKLLICTQVVDKRHSILGFFHAWVLEFARHFERIDVICLETGECDLPSHVHIHSLGKEKGVGKITQLIKFYWHFARVFFSRPNYVFFHMGAIYNILAAPFFLIRKLFGTKFYWWKAHGHTTRMEKLALKFVDSIYTTTKDSFPVSTVKKYAIGHAIDTRLFKLDYTTLKQNHILFVGRIMPVKRLDIVIEFARETNLKVRIVGPISDREYVNKLKKNFYGNVEFIDGLIGQALACAYQEASLVLNPSETGSVDKVVLEAMACGTPVLATCDIYADIIGQFGLCVSENTTEAYVKKYKNLPVTEAQKLRDYVSLNHSIDTLTKRIFGIE